MLRQVAEALHGGMTRSGVEEPSVNVIHYALYVMLNTVSIVALTLQERFRSTMGFRKPERGCPVQMDEGKWYDEETHQVFFEPYPSRNAPGAPVSRVHCKDVPEELVVRSKARGCARGRHSPPGR